MEIIEIVEKFLEEIIVFLNLKAIADAYPIVVIGGIGFLTGIFAYLVFILVLRVISTIKVFAKVKGNEEKTELPDISTIASPSIPDINSVLSPNTQSDLPSISALGNNFQTQPSNSNSINPNNPALTTFPQSTQVLQGESLSPYTNQASPILKGVDTFNAEAYENSLPQSDELNPTQLPPLQGSPTTIQTSTILNGVDTSSAETYDNSVSQPEALTSTQLPPVQDSTTTILKGINNSNVNTIQNPITPSPLPTDKKDSLPPLPNNL